MFPLIVAGRACSSGRPLVRQERHWFIPPRFDSTWWNVPARMNDTLHSIGDLRQKTEFRFAVEAVQRRRRYAVVENIGDPLEIVAKSNGALRKGGRPFQDHRRVVEGMVWRFRSGR